MTTKQVKNENICVKAKLVKGTDKRATITTTGQTFSVSHHQGGQHLCIRLQNQEIVVVSHIADNL